MGFPNAFGPGPYYQPPGGQQQPQMPTGQQQQNTLTQTQNPSGSGSGAASTSSSQAAPPNVSKDDPNSFLPPVFSSPYLQAIQQGLNLSNWAGTTIPQAIGFQEAMLGPGLTPMEQTFMNSSADLGLRGLAQTQANLMGQYENQGGNSSLGPQMLQATNQFGGQMNQLAGQLGTQRQNLAAQMLPFSMGFPLQALQSAQQGAEGLYGMAQNAMLGEMSFPLAMFGSNPFTAPTVLAQPARGGGKLGK